ncbi:MAG: hypothetical protein AABZ06_00985 [Bdellovibrionota bacterium]
MKLSTQKQKWAPAVVAIVPFIAAFAVWFSALAFVPVPWPDDSAFYFVAKELFDWPPRWVMLPQAPFEPTYRIFNFNTMPLYPVIIGIGRLIWIDGSLAIKFWPLLFWASSGALLGTILIRKGLPALAGLLVVMLFSFDPIMRWASVLVRPESFVGLCGLALVLGLSLGFPKRIKYRRLWDPVAALLALAAYAHFNAIHLTLPVLIIFIMNPKRLFAIALKTLLYLSPWIVLVIWHFKLFITQMATQWERLAVPNNWLHGLTSAYQSLFPALGSPEPWPHILEYGSICFFALFSLGALLGFIKYKKSTDNINLLPASAWVLSSAWLWHSKPEVWFVYYIHIATWCFTGLAGLKLWLHFKSTQKSIFLFLLGLPLLSAMAFSAVVFGYVDVSQAMRLGSSKTWHWKTYNEFVECVDGRLSKLESELKLTGPFRVWCPTFPDITIELSRKHPHWELTRTNDFWQRAPLAIKHGHEVEAVVITETLHWDERDISTPASEHPELQSEWMIWKEYFLNRLWVDPGWKQNRYICQRGRWQAFLFMKNP